MERVKALFDYVSELRPEEREHVLKQISDEDSDLYEKLRLMLEQAQADTEPLPPPPPTPPITSPLPFLFVTGDTIAARYCVLRAIARGGMGEVYEVDDTELGNQVALKVINLKSSARPGGLEMFRREISIARQVTHPNVCRIFDIGHHAHPEHGEVIFLTMEMLHGDTLAARIRANGLMNKEEALPIVEQMVQALHAAHSLNIVHRDFKSGNVILAETGSGSGRVVKVTDFGLARSLDGLDTTVHNDVWGTPDYMAPEQFHGQFSAASDIYAFGVVLYEMLTGKLPHRSSTGSNRPDGKPSTNFTTIPADWRPVVKKCMAYDPADRYASISQVWDALQGKEPVRRPASPILGLKRATFAVLVSVLAVAILAPMAWGNRERIQRIFDPLPEQKRIAVLPFQNIGGDPANQPFCEGIADTLTSKLSQLEPYQQALWVVPADDTRSVHSISEAERKVNANLAVTGTVQHTSDGVNLTVNLVDARKHRQLASRTLSASAGDLSVLQNRVWESVAEMIQMQVDPTIRSSLAEGGTSQPGAYEFYEQGIGYMGKGDAEGFDHAIEVFTKATEKDSQYALAYAGLGYAYAAKYQLTKDPQWMQSAVANGHRALELNDRLGPVHYTMGRIYEATGEQDRALVEFNRSLQLDPRNIKARGWIGKIYAEQGKLPEAEKQFKAVIATSPGLWSGYNDLGQFYYNHGKFPEAAEQFKTMTQLVPDLALGYQNLGGTYEQMGNYDDAITVLKNAARLKPSSGIWTNLGAAYMFVGKYSEAADAMKKAVDLSPHDHTLWRNLGDSYRQVPELVNLAPAAYQKALENAKADLQVNPRDIQALSWMAIDAAHLGQKAESQRSISKSLALAPRNGEVLFNAALVDEINGNRDGALIYLDKALKVGFSLDQIQNEPELQSLRSDSKYQKWLKQQESRVPAV